MRKIFFFVLVCLCLSLPSVGLMAQPDEVILTLAVPEWREELFEDPTIWEQFEADHPGVKVVVIANEETFYPPAAYALEDHLDGAESYASSADVLYVSTETLSVETTRAGYFLDLAPLSAGDPELNLDDFYATALESFQWERGLWGLPAVANVSFVIYDPAAFDAAGLSYPDEGWTLADFANADRELAQRDDNGDVTAPGLVMFGETDLLIRSLLGQGFYDISSPTQEPNFTDPALEALLTEFMQYQEEGLLGGTPPTGRFDMNQIALTISSPYMLSSFQASGDNPRQGALLPGGTAGLQVEGFAASSGTQSPELAYELIKYLTSDPAIVNGFFGISPARRSLVDALVDDPNRAIINQQFSPEHQALIERALENAIPTSEMRYGEYLNQALNSQTGDGTFDLLTTLEEAEAQAVENLQIAAERRETTTVFVATPVPTPVLGAGEIALDFGITSFISPMPNRDQWEEIIAEFTATDPEVRRIVMDNEFGSSLTAMAEQFDCFYLPYNYTDSEDIQSVLSLDPFLDADFEFDDSDMVGNIMQQVQRDNLTWAYPLNIQPQVLWYHTERFADAGVPAPENGWTTDQFIDALQALKLDVDGQPPFQPREFGNTFILMLTAAFGGLPMDYSVNPPAINFTEPETVAALQQVLDLAKDGYIEYNALADVAGGLIMGGSMGGGSEVQPIALYNETLNEVSSRRFTATAEAITQDPYEMAMFPSGSRYTPASYNIGTAYISASTQHPDACYRWITKLAQHPELFSAMPARRSQLDNPALAQTLGGDLISVFNQYDTVMQSPNIVEFPSTYSGDPSIVGTFILQTWLNRAMDRYVLEDADLEAELAEAEMFALDYQTCTADAVPFDMNNADDQAAQLRYLRQFFDCAISADPSMAEALPELPELEE